MFSDEAIALTKDTIAAIKILAAKARGGISQQEMISRARESLAKKERGAYHLVYTKDRRTIVAEPRDWEWEPEVGEWCIRGVKTLGLISDVRGRQWLSIPHYEHELHKDNVTPLLHWERLVSIMLSLGYWMDVECAQTTKTIIYNTVKIFNPRKKDPVYTKVYCGTQESVMLAIIEFAKEQNHAK